MPLQDQLLPLSFNKGVNTKSDNKQLTPGTPSELINVTFISPEEITKRDGHLALASSIVTGSSITMGRSLHSFYGSLVLDSGNKVYTYSTTLGKWSDNGNKISLNISSNSISANMKSTYAPTAAIDPLGLSIVGAQTNTLNDNVRFTITDTTNESIVYQIDEQLGKDAQAYDLNSKFITLTATATIAGPLVYRIIPVNNPTAATSGSLLTLAAPTANNVYLFDGVTNATHLFLAYVDATGNLVLAKYTDSLSLVTSVTVETAITASSKPSVAIDSATGNIWISYINGANSIRTATYTANLTSVYAVTTVGAGLGSAFPLFTSVVTSPTSIAFFYSPLNAAVNLTRYRTIDRVSTVTQTNVVGYHFLVGSKPFIDDNGNVCIFVHVKSTVQPTYFLIKINSFEAITSNRLSVIGKVAPLTASQMQQLSLPQIKFTQGYIFPYIDSVSQTIDAGTTTLIYNLYLAMLDYDAKSISVALGNNLTLSGALPYFYDGKGIAEVGFNVFPEKPINGGSVAGTIPAGTYSYVATYEYYDNQGNLHRSAPSEALSITVASPQANGVTVNTLTLTEAYKCPLGNTASPCYIVLYRTVNGGTTYYRVAKQLNDPANSNQGFTDNTSDATLIGSTQLYTTGGEVENISPPSTDLMTSFKNRIILVDSQNPLNWWASKQVIQGFPPEFSDLFTNSIDQRGGKITAVSTMDDKLIFFKKSVIFYVFGDGPSPAGTNNDFSYPQIVTTDVGCSNRDSVVIMPLGLMFQSDKGIYLLARSMETVYIGAAVEEYNDRKVTSAQVVPDTTQVRLTLDDSTVLVYDYFAQQWSVFTGLEFVSATTFNNKYHGLKPSGIVWAETKGEDTDDGTAIPMKFKSGWINLGGIQGFQRVKELLLVGESTEVTQLSVSFAYDFKDLDVQNTVISITETQEPTQYRVFPARQKSETIRITIQDTPSAPSRGIINLSAMTLEVGIKKGPNKMSASKSYG